jgi:chromosome segregation ATPase
MGADTDAEAAFARLEELVAQLPAIQEEDTRLCQARAARNLREAQQRASILEDELAGYKRTLEQALRDAKAAAEAGDTEEEGRNLALVRAYNELNYTRLAALERAQSELRSLLKHGLLSLDDPLEDYALPNDEYEALTARVQAFQREYQQLYDLCRRLEGLED